MPSPGILHHLTCEEAKTGLVFCRTCVYFWPARPTLISGPRDEQCRHPHAKQQVPHYRAMQSHWLTPAERNAGNDCPDYVRWAFRWSMVGRAGLVLGVIGLGLWCALYGYPALLHWWRP